MTRRAKKTPVTVAAIATPNRETLTRSEEDGEEDYEEDGESRDKRADEAMVVYSHGRRNGYGYGFVRSLKVMRNISDG